jgi:proteasome lid subunit RPN8/RPN11
VSKDESLPRENFPGGDVVPREGELRVTIEKKAYAEILAHAKEEPDYEICGVLIGKLKEDKHGTWLHLQHTIRGEGANQKGAQVTFTHEAWNHINKVWDRDFPQMGIVGWYHTHPGFDIFLSDMDKFIHNSYFDNPNQVAYVYDPQQGTEGFFRKVKDAIVPLDRFWHGGKARKIVPMEERIKTASASGGSAPTSGDVASSIAALTNAVKSLELEIRERQGGGLSNMIFTGAMGLVAIALVAFWFLTGRSQQQLVPMMVEPRTGVKLYVDVRDLPQNPPPDSKGPPPDPKPPDKK